MVNELETAKLCALAADNKKGFDILVLDLRKITTVTDHFVICSAHNTTQVSAISDGIRETLAKAGRHPSHVEGKSEANWVLMDYGDVVVHIFDEQTRRHFGLEKLWGDASRVPVELETPALKSASS